MLGDVDGTSLVGQVKMIKELRGGETLLSQAR